MRLFSSIFGRPAGKGRGTAAGLLLAAGAAIVLGGTTPILAQGMNPLQQMLGGSGRSGSSSGGLGALGGGGQVDDPNQTVLMQPAPQSSRPLPRSAVEQILSARAGVQLTQFGYREMGVARPVLLPQSGGVQENYLMGPGDEIVVTLRGQEASEFRTFVDRNGRVILPKLAPINVAGRTFSQFQQDLTAAVQRAYVATEAFVALGRVRQIRVTVGGEVNNPGLRVMTGLASAVDAVFVSNGVKKTGSLRNIQVLRNGQRIRVDLYGILRGTAGAQAPLLTDGDRVIVSPLGSTVAIAGPVRIPGIYELAPGQSGMSASALISMAGGYVVRGRYDLSLIGLAADGRTQLSDIPNDKALVRDSDILIVRGTAEQTTGRATLQAGAINSFNGNYPAQAGRLSEMLRSPGVLGDDPYPLFAIISRRDPTTLLRTLVAITPAAVMSGRQDFTLQSDDVVHTFTRTEAVNLINAINWFDERRNRQDDKIQREGQAPLLGKPEDLPPAQPRPRNRNINRDEAIAAGLTNVELAAEERRNEYNDAYVRTEDNNMLGAEEFNSSAGYNDGTGYGVAPDYNTGFDNTDYNNNAALSGGMNGVPPGAGAAGGRDPATVGLVAGSAASAMPAAAAPGAPVVQEAPVRPDPAARYRRELGRVQRLADSLKVEPSVAANFLLDHLVTLDGAVRGPGKYIVGPDLPLGTLVQAAGGTVNWSDKTGVERVSTVVDATTGQARTATQMLDLTQAQFATAVVRPRDHYRFPQANIATVGSITLKGEVRRPGVYSIVRGERLSDLLVRAGGLTSVAYPYGAVFLRKSVAAREHDGFLRAARELESQLTVSMTRRSTLTSSLTYDAIRSLVSDLRNQQALGRISVIADPAVLATRPQVDPLVEAGDVLFIPQRPSTVTVLGEVMNSSSFPSEPNMSVQEYVDRAGGYSRYADDSLTFVVLPDGTARQVEKSWFKLGSDTIPPGSTVVVPKDINPFDFRQLLVDGSQILGQLAIAAASLAVLSK